MVRIFSALLFGVFLLGWHIVVAQNIQDIRVQATVDSASIAIGDQTVLHLSITTPPGIQPTFPIVADTMASGKIQVVKRSASDTVATSRSQQFQTLRKDYVITSFDSGSHLIPAFSFKAGNKTYNTAPIPLVIRGLVVDTAKGFFDIKRPMAVSYTFFDWLKGNWPWIACTLILLAIAIAVFYYLRKKPAKQVPPAVQEPLRPVHAIALDRLKELNEQKLWQQGQLKSYYSALSTILREYLEKRYAIQAQEQATEDIFEALGTVEMARDAKALLADLLSLSDLVKFAKANPDAFKNEKSMENAVAFIQQTHPVLSLPKGEETTLGA